MELQASLIYDLCVARTDGELTDSPRYFKNYSSPVPIGIGWTLRMSVGGAPFTFLVQNICIQEGRALLYVEKTLGPSDFREYADVDGRWSNLKPSLQLT